MDTTPEHRPLNRRPFAADPRVRWIAGLLAAAAGTSGVSRAAGLQMSDVVMFGSTIVAAGAFFRASRRQSPLRRTLVLLGWSATAWVGGVGSWLGAGLLLGRGSGPNPVSSVLLIAGTFLALAGVLAGPSAPTGLGRRMRLGLEGVLAAASVLFVVWEPLVDPLLRADGRESPGEFLTLVVPGADLVFAGVIGALIWRWTNRRAPLLLLGLSAGLRTVTDGVFAYFALAGFAARGDAAVDIGWALTYATLALAALSGVGGAGTSERRLRAPGRRSQLATHLPVLAALGTAIFVGIVERHLRGAQLTILLLIAALMLMRQWITLNENRQLLDRVAFQAVHDELTGLLNRAGLLRRLAEHARAGTAVRVHLIDVDRFKDVNDTLGHPVGDALLVAVGHRLRTCTRGLDVARLGGDEFAVVDPGHDGARLAERLLAAVREPYSAAGRSIYLDASLGIAELPAGDGGTGANADQVAVDLLRDADSAMYAAKADGGGWRLFEDDLRDAMLDRVALGRELRDALARGDELTLAYQPIADLAGGGVAHVEALARWTSPRRGVVPPGVFIPIAEAAGLMPLLGTWVLRTACAPGCGVEPGRLRRRRVRERLGPAGRCESRPRRRGRPAADGTRARPAHARGDGVAVRGRLGGRLEVARGRPRVRRPDRHRRLRDRLLRPRLPAPAAGRHAQGRPPLHRAHGRDGRRGAGRDPRDGARAGSADGRRGDRDARAAGAAAGARLRPGAGLLPRPPDGRGAGARVPRPRRIAGRVGARAQLHARRTEDPGMTTVRTALTGALLLDIPDVLAAPAVSTRITAIGAVVLAPAGAAVAIAASRALSSWIDAAVGRVDRSMIDSTPP